MKKSKIVLICLIFVNPIFAEEPLSDCYRSWDLWSFYEVATEEDPILKSAEATRRAVKAVMREKQAPLLPNIQATLSRSANRTSIINPYFNGQGVSITLTQPLINLSTWENARYGRKQDAQAQVNYWLAQQNLIFRVAQAYFDLLKAMDLLEATQTQREAFEGFFEQSRQKYKTGLIAITDMEIAKARRDNAAASEVSAAKALEDQRGVLESLINRPVLSIYRLKPDLPLQEPTPNNRCDWVRQALDENFTLQSARYDLVLARSTLKNSYFQHVPTLSLNANWNKTTQANFFNDMSSQPIVRPILSTATLNLNIPIFAGGGTQAKARESAFLYQKSAYDLENQHRETERLTEQYFRGIYSQIEKAKALKQSQVSNQVALEATKSSFEHGTRTIVDVLNAETDLINAKKDYKAAQYDYLLQGLQLKAMTSTLCPEDLKAINAWLAKIPTPS